MFVNNQCLEISLIDIFEGQEWKLFSRNLLPAKISSRKVLLSTSLIIMKFYQQCYTKKADLTT